ncbi:MAG: restriction endonuclease subunit S [Acidobacteriota bacterium]
MKLIQYGSSSLANSENIGVPIIRMNNLQDDELNLTNLKYIQLSEKEINLLRLQKGDILFNRTNSKELVGKCAVFREETEYVYASYLIKVRLDETKLLPDFASLFLGSPTGRLQIDCISRQIIGMTNINTEEIKSLKLPIPPIEFQEKAVEQIKKSYAEKKAKEAEAERLLASVDDLVLDALGITLPDREENTLDKRIFFTKSSEISSGRFDPDALHPERINAIKAVQTSKYQVRKLNEIAKFVRVLTTEKILDFPYIGLENIQSNTGIYLPKNDVEEFGTANVFEIGQVLFPKLRPYLNKVFKANFAGVCSTEFYVLDGIQISNNFLACFLRTSLIVSQTKRLMTGNTLPRLQTKDVESLQIPIPPPEVQAKIAEQVETIYAEAKRLREEGKETLKQAKLEVEKMILGEG